MTGGRHFYDTGMRVGKCRAAHLKYTETANQVSESISKAMSKTPILNDRATRYASEHINLHLGRTRVSPEHSMVKNSRSFFK